LIVKAGIGKLLEWFEGVELVFSMQDGGELIGGRKEEEFDGVEWFQVCFGQWLRKKCEMR